MPPSNPASGVGQPRRKPVRANRRSRAGRLAAPWVLVSSLEAGTPRARAGEPGAQLCTARGSPAPQPARAPAPSRLPRALSPRPEPARPGPPLSRPAPILPPKPLTRVFLPTFLNLFCQLFAPEAFCSSSRKALGDGTGGHPAHSEDAPPWEAEVGRSWRAGVTLACGLSWYRCPLTRRRGHQISGNNGARGARRAPEHARRPAARPFTGQGGRVGLQHSLARANLLTRLYVAATLPTLARLRGAFPTPAALSSAPPGLTRSVQGSPAAPAPGHYPAAPGASRAFGVASSCRYLPSAPHASAADPQDPGRAASLLPGGPSEHAEVG
ncbi:alanine and proline-rich secreted protein Apa-like [Physeter macrocephalus]|uniref:Alanine and proline-rich secreted protein Apa-like n=1 Tax=Physeter macrocephalus TaxID=9755 RepID=A0A2Y9TBE8_PHYMC|nr:alanine and proline-rich secreted protein Apa-like [Physeter catodon]|eukprot:XP_023985354.1 uncharacterized protein LOC112066468 [Physeter catodon]